jgi:hypothetical protein
MDGLEREHGDTLAEIELVASRCQAALPCWEELLDEAHLLCQDIEHRVQQVVAGADANASSSADA